MRSQVISCNCKHHHLAFCLRSYCKNSPELRQKETNGKATTSFTNCFSSNFRKMMPLLVQHGSNIHFSTILRSRITLPPDSLEKVILQRFQLFITLIITSNSYKQQPPFIFHSAVPVSLIRPTSMLDRLLHSMYFLLITTSPPSSKYYFSMLLVLALTKMKISVNSSNLKLLYKVHHCLKSLLFHTVILSCLIQTSRFTPCKSLWMHSHQAEASNGYCIPTESSNYCHQP